MRITIPRVQAVMDPGSLADWLHDHQQSDLEATCAGVDIDGAPFVAWIDPTLWPEVVAMAYLPGSSDEDSADQLLAFPVFILTNN